MGRVEAYALLLASLILVGGSLGDRLGRRRVFGWGVGLFALASLWCGLAPDVTQLIIARAVQGVGAAMLVPGSLAIISASFDEEHRGRAIGTWSSFTAVTAAAGPVLGGWLVTNLSWRWVFFMNLPIAVVVLVVLVAFVSESREEQQSGPLDWRGAVLATVGLGALVFGLIESAGLGLGHPGVLGSVGGGAVALGMFVLVERRARNPIMPLSMFRSASFSGANLLTLLLYGALGGALFFLPFNLMQVQGYSATAAGAAWLPFIVIVAALSRWAGGLMTRYGAKLPLVVGPAIVCVGFLLFAVPGIGGMYWTTFFPATVVLGLGMAVSVTPLVTVVMGSVDAGHSGVAAGINNAIARTAALLAIAVLGVVMLSSFNSALDARLERIGAPPAVAAGLVEERIKLAGAALPAGLTPGFDEAVARAIDGAFVSSFRVVMLAGAGLAMAGSVAALAFIGRGQQEAALAG